MKNAKIMKTFFFIGIGGVGYIKGCYDQIFRLGFNLFGPVGKMRYLSYCADFNLTKLMQRAPAKWQDTKVEFCTCRGNLCNSQMPVNIAKTRSNTLHKFFILLSFMLILL